MALPLIWSMGERVMKMQSKYCRWSTKSSLFVLLLFNLPVAVLAFSSPVGYLNVNVCLDENPQYGTTHAEAKPMGFGSVANDLTEFKWSLLTYQPFNPLDLWACVKTKLDGVEDDFYCFDNAGVIHPYKQEGLVPFRLNATSINDTVLELNSFILNEGEKLDFYFGMTPAGEALLPFNNATIWHAEWTEN